MFEETSLHGVYLIRPTRHSDHRGHFQRLFDKEAFAKQGLETSFDHTALSFNEKIYTLRGMHYQASPFSQAKVVSCLAGRIFDAVLDLRPTSYTYTQWFGVELSGEVLIYIPKGCAHGFLTLEPHTQVLYHISAKRERRAERGILWNDPTFNIEWPAEPKVLSERDGNYKRYEKNFYSRT